jgi:hypothetical protein
MMMCATPKLAMANFHWIGPCHFELLGAMKVRHGAIPTFAPVGSTASGSHRGDGVPKVGHGQLSEESTLRGLEVVHPIKPPSPGRRVRA